MSLYETSIIYVPVEINKDGQFCVINEKVYTDLRFASMEIQSLANSLIVSERQVVGEEIPLDQIANLLNNKQTRNWNHLVLPYAVYANNQMRLFGFRKSHIAKE